MTAVSQAAVPYAMSTEHLQEPGSGDSLDIRRSDTEALQSGGFCIRDPARPPSAPRAASA